MRGHLPLATSALIVAAVPVVLAGNALLILVNPWIVHAEYALPGFPDSTIGLAGGDRKDLAVTGVRSIRPGGDGVELLRDARLPSGAPAFDQREISHMQDVRVVVRGFLIAWAVASVVAIGCAAALRRIGGPAPLRMPWRRGSGGAGVVAGAVPRALVGGSYLTLGVMGLVGLLMAVNFEFFFEGFHGIFFEGDSWRFKKNRTLRQIYPEYFWGAAGGAIAAMVALQAAAVIAVVRWRSRDRAPAA